MYNNISGNSVKEFIVNNGVSFSFLTL
jgi:hypothetical protein